MENISKDILSEIIRYLNLKDLIYLRIINKNFYSKINSPTPKQIKIFKSEKYIYHILRKLLN